MWSDNLHAERTHDRLYLIISILFVRFSAFAISAASRETSADEVLEAFARYDNLSRFDGLPNEAFYALSAPEGPREAPNEADERWCEG
jgi:hypothetical protein